MYYLGTITAATLTAQNNRDTAVPFLIPASTEGLYFQSDASGVQFEFGAASGFHTTALRGAFLPAANVLSGEYRRGGIVVPPSSADATNPARGPFYQATGIASIYNPTGGTVNVRVYASAPR